LSVVLDTPSDFGAVAEFSHISFLHNYSELRVNYIQGEMPLMLSFSSLPVL
jgi:hypothetical protein